MTYTTRELNHFFRNMVETNEIIEDTFAFRDGRKSKEAEELIV